MRLRDFNIKDKVQVVGFESTGRQYRQKLLSMGLIKGAVFTLNRVAPLGDPVEISLNSSRLSLRKNEADALIVEAAN
jgi:ferrous iron transport protein A